jgi:hypothetical protein
VSVHRVKFLIIKPIRCTNFSNLCLEWNSTCFGQYLCPSSGFLHCTHSNGMCHTGLLTACEQDQDGPQFHPDPAVSKPVWHISLLCVQWKNPDDGRSYWPKHVEFHSKNEFEKSVHLVNFIIRNSLKTLLDPYSEAIWRHKWTTEISLRQIFQLSLRDSLMVMKTAIPHADEYLPLSFNWRMKNIYKWLVGLLTRELLRPVMW